MRPAAYCKLGIGLVESAPTHKQPTIMETYKHVKVRHWLLLRVFLHRSQTANANQQQPLFRFVKYVHVCVSVYGTQFVQAPCVHTSRVCAQQQEMFDQTTYCTTKSKH